MSKHGFITSIKLHGVTLVSIHTQMYDAFQAYFYVKVEQVVCDFISLNINHCSCQFLYNMTYLCTTSCQIVNAPQCYIIPRHMTLYNNFQRSVVTVGNSNDCYFTPQKITETDTTPNT